MSVDLFRTVYTCIMFCVDLAASLSILTGIVAWQSVAFAKVAIRPNSERSNAPTPSATYLASAKDVLTANCVFNFHETAALATVTIYPLVDLRPTLQPAQSTLRNAWILRSAADPSNSIPVPEVPLTKRRTRFTQVHSFHAGCSLRWNTWPTANARSGRVQLKREMKLPMAWFYNGHKIFYPLVCQHQFDFSVGK